MSPRHSIKVVFPLSKRRYEGEVPLSQSRFQLNSNSWVWKALRHEADRSAVQRSQASEVRAVVGALERCIQSPTWLVLARKATPTLDDVLCAYRAIEETVATVTSWNANTKHSTSLRTRALLTRYLKASRFPKADSVRTLFKSRLLYDPTQRRKLISDGPVTNPDGTTTPPIAALPHRNIAELQAQTEAALSAVLDQIEGVCSHVFDKVDRARAEVAIMLTEPVDEELLLRLADLHSRRKVLQTVPDWLRSHDVADVARVYVRCFQAPGPDGTPLFQLRGREIDTYLRSRLGFRSLNTKLICFPLGIGIEVLVACMLALQKETAWNYSVVLEMSDDMITGSAPDLVLNSFKTRVGKAAPTVYLTNKSETALRAIAFLRWRLQCMKDRGWVDQDERRLWLNDAEARHGRAETFVGWDGALRDFQTRYKLPIFSLEQMRVQTLALTGERGGINAQKQRAGHDSLNTTHGYIQQLLLRRRNSAINLEFQRRVEEQVIYQDSSAPTTGNSHLLMPIGDGTSCANPHDPPEDKYLNEGVCTAKHCHQGDGCTNRRIVIDELRVEEALRFETYYRANWGRLLDENRAAFDAYHLPTMVFNACLVEVLEKGPYAHVVRDVRRQLDEETGDGQ
jgi:hypothetical protein